MFSLWVSQQLFFSDRLVVHGLIALAQAGIVGVLGATVLCGCSALPVAVFVRA